MTRVITYTRPDGGVSVVNPAWNDGARPVGDTDDALIARCLARSVPADATNVQVIEDTRPADRTFRNALTPMFDTDMPKARAIHMDRIRAARNAKLATLDGPWMRATGRGDTATATAIETQRETLRNLPQTVDLNVATTPEQLKAIWPVELS